MSAPTDRQLDILRAMAAGLRLVPQGDEYAITFRGSTAAGVKPETVHAMTSSGWITREDDRFALTRAGLAHAECKTFVRAFCEAVPVSA